MASDYMNMNAKLLEKGHNQQVLETDSQVIMIHPGKRICSSMSGLIQAGLGPCTVLEASPEVSSY